MAFLVTQTVKNPPVMQETRLQSLGWEDPLEKEMAPLQYSCLENPMDRGSWQATVQFHGCSHHRRDLGAQENKVWHAYTFPPSIGHEKMGLDAMVLVF